MAIKMTKDSKLRVIFETGLTEEGKPIYKTKSYSNLAEDVTQIDYRKWEKRWPPCLPTHWVALNKVYYMKYYNRRFNKRG